MDERVLLIGFDLGNEYSQVCCLSEDQKEAEPVISHSGQEFGLIPTALCRRAATSEWLIGEEAVRSREFNESGYVTNLLDLLRQEEKIKICDTEYAPDMLLGTYISHVLDLVQQKYGEQDTIKIAVTARELIASDKQRLRAVLRDIGYQQDRAIVLSYGESFLYYAVNQKQELWQNDVALFDFSSNGLKFFHLTLGRRSKPVAAALKVKELSDSFPFSLLERETEERLSYHLQSLVEQQLHRLVIGTLYFTGEGFDGEWPNNVLKLLCTGRRVFKGQNLFTRGACFAALAAHEGERKDIVFLDEEKLTASFSLKVFQDTKETELFFAQAGQDWADAGDETRVILDDTRELTFVINDIMKKEPAQEIFALDGIGERENKTMQLSIHVYFTARNTAVVRVKDIGFGSFYETSHRIWEQIIVF